MFCCLHGKAKKKISEWLPRVNGLWHSGKRVSSPSAWAAALEKEGFFPECLDCGARERGFLPRVPGLLATNGVNSFPSANMALRKAFPECTIFGSRRRRLSREEIPRVVFSECCTRERIPRVQQGHPQVHLALGEATASRSDDLFILYLYKFFE